VKYYRSLTFKCRVASDGGFQLGIAAASLLLAAHIVCNVSGGCRWTTPHVVAAAFLLLSWISFITGMGLLIVGLISNSKSKEFCSLTNHKLLAIGGLVAFIHGVVSVAYYVVATMVTIEEKRNDIEGSNLENT
ncbi:hypothetical protein KI387_001855, partial [Taxus chinensis]